MGYTADRVDMYRQHLAMNLLLLLALAVPLAAWLS